MLHLPTFMRSSLAVLAALFLGHGAAAQTIPGARDRWFSASDGVRLHYLEAGPAIARCIVLVPGWTMPAWIWARQIEDFRRLYRVVAFDPRGQGASEIALDGYTPARRGQDIAELIARLSPRPVLLVGWSLGVLDSLAYIHEHGDAAIAGLVLVDNSVGEQPAPVPPPALHRLRPLPREIAVRRFVVGMFRTPQNPAWLEALVRTSLRLPESDARALLAYPEPRSYWRDALYGTDKPVLYVVRPKFAAQAFNLVHNRPNTEDAVFAGAGHALFVDDAARFDALVASFIRRRVWP